MKKSILSLVALAYIITGCGDSKNEKVEKTSIETIEEAKAAFGSSTSFTGFESLNSFDSVQKQHKVVFKSLGQNIFMLNDINNILSSFTDIGESTHLNKQQSLECAYGGSASLEKEENPRKETLTYNQCKETASSTINGKMILTEEIEKEKFKLDFSELTIKKNKEELYVDATWIISVSEILNGIRAKFEIDGVFKATSALGKFKNISFSNYIQEITSIKNSSGRSINGVVSLENNCYSKSYNFITQETLISTSKNSNIESGILQINDALYTFENPYVTIKMSSTEKTILQSELKKTNPIEECKD